MNGKSKIAAHRGWFPCAAVRLDLVIFDFYSGAFCENRLDCDEIDNMLGEAGTVGYRKDARFGHLTT
jgi:hypothetical protein